MGRAARWVVHVSQQWCRAQGHKYTYAMQRCTSRTDKYKNLFQFMDAVNILLFAGALANGRIRSIS